MARPISVPPGSWVRTVAGPSARASRTACVDLPLPSMPSSVMNVIASRFYQRADDGPPTASKPLARSGTVGDAAYGREPGRVPAHDAGQRPSDELGGLRFFREHADRLGGARHHGHEHRDAVGRDLEQLDIVIVVHAGEFAQVTHE